MFPIPLVNATNRHISADFRRLARWYKRFSLPKKFFICFKRKKFDVRTRTTEYQTLDPPKSTWKSVYDACGLMRQYFVTSGRWKFSKWFASISSSLASVSVDEAVRCRFCVSQFSFFFRWSSSAFFIGQTPVDAHESSRTIRGRVICSPNLINPKHFSNRKDFLSFVFFLYFVFETSRLRTL